MVWNIPAIPEMIGHKFEDIFVMLIKDDVIPLALQRCPSPSNGSYLPFVYTCPDKDAVVNEGDHLYILASSEWWSQKANKYTADLQKPNDTHTCFTAFKTKTHVLPQSNAALTPLACAAQSPDAPLPRTVKTAESKEMADMEGGFKQMHVLNLLRVKVEDMLNTQALMLSMMSDTIQEVKSIKKEMKTDSKARGSRSRSGDWRLHQRGRNTESSPSDRVRERSERHRSISAPRRYDAGTF
jgi:hypothetical protein